jgi:hypothetical protein
MLDVNFCSFSILPLLLIANCLYVVQFEQFALQLLLFRLQLDLCWAFIYNLTNFFLLFLLTLFLLLILFFFLICIMIFLLSHTY